MSGTTAGATTAAYTAMVAEAIKACGTLVRVEPQDFLKIVERQEHPLVVKRAGGTFSQSIKYLTSYRGLAFHCKTKVELSLPGSVELIHARKFSMPDV